MEYTDPKTDWKSSDYINIEDYARIYNNQTAIYETSEPYTMPYQIDEIDLPTYSSTNTFELVNVIARRHNVLVGMIPLPGLERVRELSVENPFMYDYNELNSIEKAIKVMYENMPTLENLLYCGVDEYVGTNHFCGEV